MMDEVFAQFELWRNCPNNCDFCWQKNLKIENKRSMLLFAKKKIEESSFDKIGFIGGEIFGNEMKINSNEFRFFLDIIKICVDKIKIGKLKWVYIASGLLFSETDSLLKILDYINEEGVIENFLLCTSYDTKYRFHNKNSICLWENNIKLLHKRYSNLSVHTEIIITEDFIQKVLDGSFDVLEFQKKYNTRIDFISAQCNDSSLTKEEYDKKLPMFIPKRKSFLRFLLKLKNENIFNLSDMFNKNFHSDILYLFINGKICEIRGRNDNWKTLGEKIFKEFNRNIFEFGYIDSDISMEDDVRMLCQI